MKRMIPTKISVGRSRPRISLSIITYSRSESIALTHRHQNLNYGRRGSTVSITSQVTTKSNFRKRKRDEQMSKYNLEKNMVKESMIANRLANKSPSQKVSHLVKSL